MATRLLAVTRPSPPQPEASTSPRLHFRPLLAVAAIGTLLLAVPLAASGAFYGSFALSDGIAQGVTVAGLSVGGLTIEEAATALNDLWNRQLTLQVVDPPTGNAWTLTPRELGLSVDAWQTAERAFSVGREQRLMEAVQRAATSLHHGIDLDPVVNVDLAAARSRLEVLAPIAGTLPQDASMEIVEGAVRRVPGNDGRRLDIDATLELMAADPTALLVRYGFVPLIFSPQPPAIANVDAAAEQADRLLSAPASLVVYDPVTDETLEWAPDRTTIGGWIQIGAGGSPETIELVPTRISAAVADWVTSLLGSERQIDIVAAAAALQESILGSRAQPVVLTYRPTTYAAQGGESLAAIGFRNGLPTWKIQEYNPSTSPYRALAAGTEVVLPPRDAMLLLPMVPNKRIVISISEQHLWTYEDGALRSDHVISTGIARSPTLPGLFQVLSHIEDAYASRWDLWMPHFLGIYDALPGFTNGIHGLPLLSSGTRLWANVLGRPASYGCIILDLDAAEDVYTWAEDGVVVEIRR
jgi:lipoprotein-anchoring transpeptidase ErfK/SrfK